MLSEQLLISTYVSKIEHESHRSKLAGPELKTHVAILGHQWLVGTPTVTLVSVTAHSERRTTPARLTAVGLPYQSSALSFCFPSVVTSKRGAPAVRTLLTSATIVVAILLS